MSLPRLPTPTTETDEGNPPMETETFLFAVPRDADRESRERVPQHIALHFGVIPSTLFHVRSDDQMHVYGGIRPVKASA